VADNSLSGNGAVHLSTPLLFPVFIFIVVVGTECRSTDR
jgi:hypothetical protein